MASRRSYHRKDGCPRPVGSFTQLTKNSTLSIYPSGRRGRRPELYLAKLLQHFHRIPSRIMDGDLQRHLPGQGMGRAAEAWIVGAERHLHHVEQTLRHFAVLNEMGRRLVRGHLDRRVVVCGADDEICPGNDAALVSPVVMRESTARRLDDSDPFRRDL